MKRNKVKNKIKMNSTKVNGNERIDIYNALRKIIDDICEDEIVKITLEFLYDEIKGIRNNFDFIETFVKEWIELEEGLYIDYILNVIMDDKEEVEFISIGVMESI